MCFSQKRLFLVSLTFLIKLNFFYLLGDFIQYLSLFSKLISDQKSHNDNIFYYLGDFIHLFGEVTRDVKGE